MKLYTLTLPHEKRSWTTPYGIIVLANDEEAARKLAGEMLYEDWRVFQLEEERELNPPMVVTMLRPS